MTGPSPWFEEPPLYRGVQQDLGGPDPLTASYPELQAYLDATQRAVTAQQAARTAAEQYAGTGQRVAADVLPKTPAGRWLADLARRVDGHDGALHVIAAELIAIRRILTRMETLMTVQQSDLDAIAQSLTALDDAVGNLSGVLTADDAGIQAELTALQQQVASQAPGVQLDLTGVQAALAKTENDIQTNLGAAVAATTALVPPPAAPATPSPDVAPAPAPTDTTSDTPAPTDTTTSTDAPAPTDTTAPADPGTDPSAA